VQALVYISINSLVVSGNNIYGGYGYGIFRSTNSGLNGPFWIQTFLPTPIYSLVTNATDIFAGTINGVFLSRDNAKQLDTY